MVRFDVVPAGEEVGGFVVEIFVNGVEMTAAGAGLGMDPYDVLVPTNRFVATTTGATIPAARCECGVYGCGSTDLTIIRDGDVVHWEWEGEVPVNRRLTFATRQYDAEVHRVGADRHWETPERRAGRLILETVDRAKLAESHLRISWVGTRWNDPSVFEVALLYGDSHQVFVGFPWGDRDADELAGMVTDRLARTRPSEWNASWHGISPEARGQVPEVAGSRWTRHQL